MVEVIAGVVALGIALTSLAVVAILYRKFSSPVKIATGVAALVGICGIGNFLFLSIVALSNHAEGLGALTPFCFVGIAGGMALAFFGVIWKSFWMEQISDIAKQIGEALIEDRDVDQ